MWGLHVFSGVKNMLLEPPRYCITTSDLYWLTMFLATYLISCCLYSNNSIWTLSDRSKQTAAGCIFILFALTASTKKEQWDLAQLQRNMDHAWFFFFFTTMLRATNQNTERSLSWSLFHAWENIFKFAHWSTMCRISIWNASQRMIWKCN